jgi:hypothetical protein
MPQAETEIAHLGFISRYRARCKVKKSAGKAATRAPERSAAAGQEWTRRKPFYKQLTF